MLFDYEACLYQTGTVIVIMLRFNVSTCMQVFLKVYGSKLLRAFGYFYACLGSEEHYMFVQIERKVVRET